MSYPTILERYASNLIINFDARSGDIRERVTGQEPTFNGTPFWGRGQGGWGIVGSVGSSGYLQWSANSIWDLSNSGSLVVQCSPSFTGGTSQVLVSRATLVPSTSLGYIITANGGTSAISLASATGSFAQTILSYVNRFDHDSVLASVWDSTMTVRSFANGDRTNMATYTQIPTPSGQPLRIAGFDARACRWPVQRVLAFNVALPEQDVAQLYEEMSSKTYVLNAKIKSNIPPVLNNAILTMNPKFDWERKIQNLADPSKIGTPSGTLGTFSDGLYGLTFDGSGHVSFGDTTGLNSANNHTLECVFSQAAANASDAGIITKATSTTAEIGIRLNASSSFGINAIVKNGSDTYGTAITASYNNYPIHVMTVYSASGAANADRLKLYLFGEEQTLSFVGTIPSTPPSLSGGSLIVGNEQIGTTNRNFNGTIFRANAYNKSFSAQEVKRSYLEWARVPSLKIMDAGRWLIGTKSGTGSTIDDAGWISENANAYTEHFVSGTRVFQSLSATTLFRQHCDQTVGTWEWSMASAGTTVGIDMIRTDLARSANAGYSITLNSSHQPAINRLNSINIFTGTALSANTLYKFRATRKPNGQIDLWYKPANGPPTSWQYSGGVTDTTSTGRNLFISISAGAGCLISREFTLYPGPIAPGDISAID